jgi:hypothetical protein
MPKSLFEIRTFQHGIISTPSETDIPQEAATFSVDVDPILEGGKLGGMPGHVEEKDGSSHSIPADQMCFIEAKNGTRTLAYIDHSDTTLAYVNNFEEGTRGSITSSSTSFDADDDYAALATHGHEVHIGMGATKDAKWYGYLKNDQFGSGTCPTTPQYLDAKLERLDDVSTGFGGFHKVITAYEGSYAQVVHIGIEWKGDTIRAFDDYDLSTEFTVTLVHLAFTSLQAVCEDPTDPNYFFAYDDDDTEYGTVYRIHITSLTGSDLTLTKHKAIVVNGWGTAGLEEPEEYTVSDMISDNHTYNSGGTYTNCYLYFAMHKENGGVPIVFNRSQDVDEVFALNEEYSVGYPTLIFRSSGSHPEYGVSNDGMDTYNVTPTLKATDESQSRTGKFFLNNTVTGISDRFDIYTLKRPFFNVGVRNSAENPTNGAELIGYCFTSKTVTASPKISTYSSGPDNDRDNNWRPIGLSAIILKPFDYWADYTDRGSYHFACSHLRLLSIGGVVSDTYEPPYKDKILNSFQAQLFRSYYSGVYLPYLAVSVSTDSSTKLMIFDPDCAVQAMAGTAFYLSNGLYVFDEMGATVSSVGSPEATTSIDLTGMTMFAPGWSGSSGTGNDTDIKFVSEYGGIISGEISVFIASTTSISFNGTAYTDTPDMYCMAYQSSGQDADGIRAGEILTYHIALEYDGYQIAPMSEPITTITPSEDGKPIILNLYLKEAVITDISQRVTGAYILRGTKNSLVGTSFASIPRVVEKIDFTVAKNEVTLAGTSGYYKYQVYDRNRLAETFDSLSGYSSDATTCTPKYGISCVGNDQLLVGDCGGLDGDCDSTSILYLSEPGKYDQFNLSTNFVILSDEPTAMCFWRGKFYVFSSSKMWRINPNGPYIEDDFEGIGVEGPQGVIANEFGIFVAGVKGIYLDVGSGFVPIGDTILNSENGNYGWNDRDTSYSPIVFFDPERKAFCASFKWDGIEDLTLVYAYSIGLKRWDLWQMVAEKSLNGVLTGRNGAVYAAAETNVYSIFANKSSRRPYTWHSKVLDMGTNSKDKKFYEIRIPYQRSNFAGSIAVDDQDGNSISLASHNETKVQVRTFNTRDRGIKVKLTSIAGDCFIDSIGVIYRNLNGVH